MKIPPIYFVYFGAALLVGLIFSFGVVGIFHQPVPLQVQLEQYKPAQPPAPAIPTIAPSAPSPDKFAPAPAPVVVTTAPLPTITPSPTQSVGKCDVSAGSDATSFACIMEETIEPIRTALTLMGIMLIGVGALGLLYMFSGLGGGI